MKINVCEVSPEEYTQAVKKEHLILPLWLSPLYTNCYREKLILLAKNKNKILGVWVLPLDAQDKKRVAKREFRFFPYVSPIIFSQDNLERREVMMVLCQYVMNICQVISLPMHPDFKDLSVVQSLGALIEWRHTHEVSSPLSYRLLGSRLRNHLHYSREHVKVFIDQNPGNFRFDLAIKGGDAEKEKRKQLALALLTHDNAIIIYAKQGERLCAGVLLTFDEERAYMLHNWQDENTPRGTIINLIFEAIDWTFNKKKLQVYDLEGSVFYDIDYFFSGFNCNISPYGYIHWAEDKQDLFNLVDKAINISGRLYEPAI